MSQITVQEVLAGSRRIDEMKQEIEDLIKMCAGLINARDMVSDIWPESSAVESSREINCGADRRWQIVMRRGGGHGPYIHHVRWFGRGYVTTFPIQGRAEWADVTPMKIVNIRDTLQKLLDGFLTFFPDLGKALDPFLQALE